MIDNPNRLLKRQLKKINFTDQQLEEFTPFLEMVNQAYSEFSIDIQHIEHILEISSQELFNANQKLQSSVDRITNKLERVANNIQEVIFETNIKGEWEYLNPAWELMTGFKVNKCIGRPYQEYLQYSSENQFSFLDELKNAKTNALKKVININTQHNGTRWIEISVSLVKDQQGQPTGTIGTIVDITRQKEIEKSLIEARDKERKANNAKDEFLSTMSHEIRTPLNSVIGMTHLLLLEDPKEDQLENLQALKYSSEHLLGIVNDVLDFNKIESGLIELEHNDFSLDHMLNGIQSTFGNKAAEKNIRFVIKKDDLLPQVVIGDTVRFNQVLTNLTNNAIKFTSEGKVVLDIEVIEQTDEYVDLLIEVTDTGIGIAKENQGKIFEYFSQASSNTTRKYGGSGLGLAICQKLLKLMGSELTVESELGKGSIFSFTIRFGASKKFIQSQTSNNVSASSFAGLNDFYVLVVEDHKMNILVIKKFFNKWNVNVEIAENGEIAVAMASKNNYDMILMDLQMPVMNGYDAAQAIRDSGISHNESIPIYALTASASIDVEEKVRRYGMNGHISKPFNPSELYQKLKRIRAAIPKPS